jgi:putative transposase
VPRFPRLVVPSFPHHVTQRGVRRQTTFFENSDYLAYLRLATGLLKKVDIEVWAYCLMPNHVHAVVVPGATSSLSEFFAPLHRRYACRTNNRLEWRGHLWQERFYSVVMDEPHTLSAMRYVELNPVRAGLCGLPEDWPWSSARGNLGLAIDPLVARRATQKIVTNWHEYLGAEACTEDLDRLRQETLTGRPAGSAEFVNRLEKLSGRRIRKKRPGRKARE